MIFDMTNRTRRVVAGLLALGVVGAGVGGAVAAATAAPGTGTPMAGLTARHHDPVPPAMLKLSYLEREIELQSRAGGSVRERAVTIQALRSAWAQARPGLVAAGGAKVAAAYDAHVRTLGIGADPAALQREAVRGLHIVDQMQGVFLGK